MPELCRVGFPEDDWERVILELSLHQLDLHRDVAGSFTAPVREVQLLGEHIEQVPELVVGVLLGAVFGPRWEVEDLLAGSGHGVWVGFELGELGGEAVLDAVAGNADVQLQRPLDALQLLQLRRRLLQVLQIDRYR